MIALLFWLGAAAAQPTLQEVMDRAARYVAEFEDRLAGIVAEEQYVQRIHRPKDAPSLGSDARRLISDLLLVRPIGADDWIQFRDVFEVDGSPVRDRQDRLIQIFLTPGASTQSQASTILTESTRYNIGAVERTVNTPTIALKLLEKANQSGFAFRRTQRAAPHEMTRESPVPPGHFRAPLNAWIIEFSERRKPTVVQTLDRSNPYGALIDLPARGRFWIDPSTGRVLMSEMVLDATGARAAITVNYQSEPLLGFLVPTEMRERYDRLRDHTTVEGFATYERFRQFQVKVDEKLGPIKK